MISLLRRTGDDPPFSDHRRYHGVPMEGWFWRFTTASGAVAVVLCSVNRDGAGGVWGMCAVALGSTTASARKSIFAEGISETASADSRGGVRIGSLLVADTDRVRVELDDAEVHVSLADVVPWPRRTLGGIGPGHLVPWLGQYWHPHVLGGRVTGSIRVGDRTVSLNGATVYAEKNWGRGFPDSWWWAQAQGFPERDDACVAFAGGPLGPLQAGALVVRLGDELIHVVRPPLPLRTSGVRPPYADLQGKGDTSSAFDVPAGGVRPPYADLQGKGGVSSAFDVGHSWRLRARSARYVVEVEVRAADEPLRLPVPVPAERGVVHGPSEQHLAAELRLQVRRGATTVFEGTSSVAGFELGSPTRRGGAPRSAQS